MIQLLDCSQPLHFSTQAKDNAREANAKQDGVEAGRQANGTKRRRKKSPVKSPLPQGLVLRPRDFAF